MKTLVHALPCMLFRQLLRPGRLWFLPLLSLVVNAGNAQQLPAQRGYLFTGMFWNPAMTAPGDYLEASALFSQQWVGFEGAPVSMFASAQVPFPDWNTAMGLVFRHDQAGPLSHLGTQANYAYNIRDIFDFQDQLSAGISANITQWRFNPLNLNTYNYADPTLYEEPVSRWQTDIAFGVFYTSDRDFSFRRSHYYVGLSGGQLTRFFLSGGDQVPLGRAAAHIHALAGYRHVKYDHCWEPTLFLDLTAGRIRHGGVSLRYERDARFWFNTALELNGDTRLGGGLMVQTGRYFSTLWNTKLSGKYLLGAEAGMNPWRSTGIQNLSYHFYLGYRTLILRR